MPRPDKKINPGRLDGPVSPSRSQSWTKYGGAETVEGHRGAPSSDDPATVEVSVDDITVTDHPDGMDSKYTTRGTAAHGVGPPDEDLDNKPVVFVTEWVVDRTVEGRIYHRTDRLVMVQLER